MTVFCYASPMRIGRILWWSVLLVLVAMLGLFLLASDSGPAPGLAYPLSRADIDRAERLLRQHDPRRLRNGAVRNLLVTERDLNVTLNYLLSRTKRGSIQIDLRRGRLDARLSLRLPSPIESRWLNLRLTLQEDSPYPRIAALRIGSLPIANALLPTLSRFAIDQLEQDRRTAPIMRMLQQLRFFHGRLYARYRWNPDSLDGMRDTLLGSLDQDSLNFYYQNLRKISRQFPLGAKVPLERLLPPLFAAAQRRSTWHDPVAENRALLSVLAAWIGGHGLSALVDDYHHKPRARPLRPVLRGRRDLAKHLLISAALTIGSDTGIANAIGLYKEIRDSWRGSGFSFTDLAADIAGARLGELATTDADSARRIQRRIAAGIDQDALLPPVEDLPENLSAQEFAHRFDDTESAEYQRLLDLITTRVNQSPLLRNE